LLAAEGVSARVLNMSTLAPIDREAIGRRGRADLGIVTVEEHSIHGGLGSAVAEVVVAPNRSPCGFSRARVFAPTGSTAWLLEHFD